MKITIETDSKDIGSEVDSVWVRMEREGEPKTETETILVAKMLYAFRAIHREHTASENTIFSQNTTDLDPNFKQHQEQMREEFEKGI